MSAKSIAALAVFVAGVALSTPALAQCPAGEAVGTGCNELTTQGCCGDDMTVYYCYNGTVCRQECSALLLQECGWSAFDGMYACMFLPDTPPPEHPQTCDFCGDITYQGCCDGSTARYCMNGVVVSDDCPSLGDSSYLFCGWTGDEYGYWCNGDTSVGGGLPRECPEPVCEPDCHGRQCGDDGCGGSCGICTSPDECDASTGRCVAPCVPDCTGRECGDDGCGGACGFCGWGEECDTRTGLCGEVCVPDCSGRACGDDGCGGSCGTCTAGDSCIGGLCQCAADCRGRVCGEDGCGGTCGTCPQGQSCEAGQCVGCAPECDRRQCGADGCGGTCGTCATGLVCDEEYGLCITDTTCQRQCAGKQCGDDGCGGTCGACAIGLECQSGACVEHCTPDCAGRACGDDGCGGSCGECGADATCTPTGVCLNETPLPADDVVDGDDSEQPGDDVSEPKPEQDTSVRSNPNPPLPDCPAGWSRRYGVCIQGQLAPPEPYSERFSATSLADSGCAAGSGPAPTGAALLFLLALSGLAFRRTRA